MSETGPKDVSEYPGVSIEPALAVLRGTEYENLIEGVAKVGLKLEASLWAAGGLLAVATAYYLAIRAKGLTVTSWFRSPLKNMAIHKAFLEGKYPNDAPTWDWHVFGLAWDVVPDTDATVAALKSLGLRVLREGTHVHSQLIPTGWI